MNLLFPLLSTCTRGSPCQGGGCLSICLEEPVPEVSLPGLPPAPPGSVLHHPSLFSIFAPPGPRAHSLLSKPGTLGMASSVSPRCRSQVPRAWGLSEHVGAALAKSSHHPGDPLMSLTSLHIDPGNKSLAAKDRRREKVLSVSWVTMWIVIKTKTQN